MWNFLFMSCYFGRLPVLLATARAAPDAILPIGCLGRWLDLRRRRFSSRLAKGVSAPHVQHTLHPLKPR